MRIKQGKIKKLIAPLQGTLLARHICPGCLQPLSIQNSIVAVSDTAEQVTCNCGRIFMHDKEKDSYRRALSSEVV